MKISVSVVAMTLMASSAFAQLPDSASAPTRSTAEQAGLATPTGHDVSGGLASYTYSEPGTTSISIHGTKFTTDYAGTFSINKQQHWFGQAEVRGTLGSVTYDGWCSPFIITPDGTSPNGYALDVGDPSSCTESGDKDWYVEARGLTGKDFIGQGWSWSPYTGLGLRHLSNGTTGVSGYRTDDYLYLPVGVTTRTNAASHGALSLNVEFDALLHGWQTTRDSQLGGGDVPPTPTAPAFTVNGFSDISFSQSGGWALRASGRIPVSARLAVEPYYVRWQVDASPVNYETATFTVNNITAQEQMGAYEPHNITSEFGVRLHLHF
jgi:hypothetical protein